MSRRRLTRGELADEWIRLHDPASWDDPDLWPRVDEGRVPGQVSFMLTEVRAEQAALHGRLEPAPRRKRPTGPLCSHCGLDRVAISVTVRKGREFHDICRRCHRHVLRKGELPSPRLNKRHARRLGDLHFATNG